jgi:methyl-accepting chemotaxis protein
LKWGVKSRLGKVSGAGNQLISTATNVTVIIEDAVRETTEISTASSEILNIIQGIAAEEEEEEEEEEMQVSSKEIATKLENSNKVFAEVVDENKKATNSAKRLKEIVESVQGVVVFIEGIATQINLLALNASIESA